MPQDTSSQYAIQSPIWQIITNPSPSAFDPDNNGIGLQTLPYGGDIAIGKVNFGNSGAQKSRLAIYGRVENNIYNFLSYDCQEIDNSRTYVDIGGIKTGTTKEDLNGKPITEILDLLIFPEIDPTIEAPSASISLNSSSFPRIQEVGSAGNSIPSADDFQKTWNPGMIYIVEKANKQNDRAGAVNSSMIEFASADGTWSEALTSIILEGNNSYRWKVDYSQGPQPLTSKGNDFGSPLQAGTIYSNTVTITGVYPYFGNTITSSELTKLPLTKDSSFEFDAVSEDKDTGRHKFSLPAKYNVTSINYWDTVAEDWRPMSLALFDKSDVKQNVQGTEVDYQLWERNEEALSGATKFQVNFTK